ncbi:hypothetical protein AB5J56_44005 [Streptomyces sp. R21]|uniref:Uncharacterized protein n=1 Tax=Streptomyces sp. R21 TaxID=3238627 RepID=A0AB39PNT5_9ACTN
MGAPPPTHSDTDATDDPEASTGEGDDEGPIDGGESDEPGDPTTEPSSRETWAGTVALPLSPGSLSDGGTDFDSGLPIRTAKGEDLRVDDRKTTRIVVTSGIAALYPEAEMYGLDPDNCQSALATEALPRPVRVEADVEGTYCFVTTEGQSGAFIVPSRVPDRTVIRVDVVLWNAWS